MRVVLAAIAMGLGLVGAAAADSPRYLPTVGTTVIYRSLQTRTAAGQERTFGKIYRLTTTASDATTAENTLTPLALIYPCPDSDTSRDCRQVRSFPNISRDGDLVTIPVPADIAEGLAKLGKLTMHDFLSYTRTFPTPGPQDIDEVVKPRFGTAPLFIDNTTLACDEAVLKKFFPFGAAVQVTVPCEMTTERSYRRIGAGGTASKTTATLTYQLSFAGHEHIVVPAGDYLAAVIRFKSTPASGSGPIVEGEWAIIEALGFSAKYSALVRFPDSPNTTAIERELIKVGP